MIPHKIKLSLSDKTGWAAIVLETNLPFLLTKGMQIEHNFPDVDYPEMDVEFATYSLDSGVNDVEVERWSCDIDKTLPLFISRNWQVIYRRNKQQAV